VGISGVTRVKVLDGRVWVFLVCRAMYISSSYFKLLPICFIRFLLDSIMFASMMASSLFLREHDGFVVIFAKRISLVLYFYAWRTIQNC